jgi:hypothetical protein
MKSHGKWKHGRSNVEKLRRKNIAESLEPESEIHGTVDVHHV